MPLDFFAYGLTFFFVFAIVYGALEVSGVFRRRVNTLIALVLGFFVLTSEDVVLLVYNLLPFAAIFFLIFFFIGFVLSFVRKGAEKDWTLGVIVAGFVLIILASQTEPITDIFPSLSEGFLNTLLISIAIILILVILYGAYRQSGGAPAK